MSQKRSTLPFGSCAAFALAAAYPALGVTLNPRGTGQVLLYPYYTVNANNQTLISIVNTTAHSKALRVRVAEGENGRDVLSMNLYLHPFDVWTAAVFDAGTFIVNIDPPSHAAGITTDDTSCTVPALTDTPFILPDGRRFVPFSNAAFAAEHADAGTSDDSRTREGTIEVIEMGTLADGSPSANADCQALVAAWIAPDGYWSQNPATDLVNPTGGIFGSGYVVNVAAGTIFQYATEAIDDFRADPLDQPRGSTASVVLHTAPGTSQPSLADALTDPANAVAAASVMANGTTISASYPAPAQAVDAVSAVLATSSLYNEFLTDPALGASTDWILAFPTRRFYTDPAIVGDAAIAPFAQLFGVSPSPVPFEIFNREASGLSSLPFCDDMCSTLTPPGTSVYVLIFTPYGGVGSDVLGSRLAADFIFNPPPMIALTSGWAALGFDGSADPLIVYPQFPGPTEFLRASAEGKYFAGWPIVGFSAQNIINANATAGVLANYSSAVPHRVTTKCFVADPSNPQNLTVPCQ